MYAFMYVNAEKNAEEEYFTDTITFVGNYNKFSTPVSVPKHWLGFSCICSEDYELDMNFDEIQIQIKSDQFKSLGMKKM